MAGTAQQGRLRLALSYSLPHRFWTIAGRSLSEVTVGEDDDAHVMATLWDAETGTVLPASSPSLELTLDGEPAANRSLWPMLAQRMGMHFGDNVSLSGDGTYEATVSVGALQARRTGELADVLGEQTTIEAEFEYSAAETDAIEIETLPERAGEPGAVEPMGMEMLPTAAAPPADDLPGRALGTGESGDAIVAATAIEGDSRFVDGSGTYLAVSPRTRYNAYPLPFATLSATLLRGTSTVFDDDLGAAIDHELGYHYGATVDAVESGDLLSVSFDAPPQLSRHAGYQTSLLDLPVAELTVP